VLILIFADEMFNY